VSSTRLIAPAPSIPIASSSSSSRSSSSSKKSNIKGSLIESGILLHNGRPIEKRRNDCSVVNRQQIDSSIEKISEVTGIGIESDNYSSKSRTKLPARESSDNTISDRQQKCSNISNEKYFLALQNRISHCSHSLRKNKSLVRISSVFASFLIAYIAINIIMRITKNNSTIITTQENVCSSASSNLSDESFLEGRSDGLVSMSDIVLKSDSAHKLAATVHWVRAGASISLGFNDVNSNSFIGDKHSNSQLRWHDYFRNNVSDIGGDMDEENTPAPLYQWRKNGLNITNFSESHKYFTIKKFKSSDEGIYQYVAMVLYTNQVTNNNPM
jgi:hypothetical protein